MQTFASIKKAVGDASAAAAPVIKHAAEVVGEKTKAAAGVVADKTKAAVTAVKAKVNRGTGEHDAALPHHTDVPRPMFSGAAGEGSEADPATVAEGETAAEGGAAAHIAGGEGDAPAEGASPASVGDRAKELALKAKTGIEHAAGVVADKAKEGADFMGPKVTAAAKVVRERASSGAGAVAEFGSKGVEKAKAAAPVVGQAISSAAASTGKFFTGLRHSLRRGSGGVTGVEGVTEAAAHAASE